MYKIILLILCLTARLQAEDSWYTGISETISGYFQDTTLISEENLAYYLENMLYYVIEGGTYEPGQHAPEALSEWIPIVDVESTLSRRDRYLREYQGNQEAATEAAIKRNHTYARSLTTAITGVVPVFGAPVSYSMTLWRQLREIALIAALHGHDLHDQEVKVKILSALLGGNALKIPAASVDLVARQIVKMILAQAGVSIAGTIAVPAHLLFNFLTENSAKVSVHAKELFAGVHSLPIPEGVVE